MEILMRKFALLSASALVLALGVASASAQPSGQQFLIRGETGVVGTYGSSALSEGRAASIEAPALLDQHHAAGH
jgi:hypothetical protein